ncbi:MAG: antA/AntB antirepressor family protein [Ruminococcus callidus]|jgi:anti-repressor protein|uniref:antA/AntB antirepressor family protein n=1 Tax=Ruminococcus callidus TaxID=40519 RepID=UPI000ED81203|nr:antA/AntB antirepressor family protein [Ruminococcus callidus]HCD40425.1 phage antirepressor Ant [Ruminococcus sp.]HCY34125.1 phage antirepressor Ant [Ruminococcus sp.]
MKDLIQIHYDNADRPTVSGRELYEALEVKTAYKDWFPRMCEYGFSEGKDYCSFLSDRSDGKAGKPRTDHQLTIPMAKELCMLQRTDKGKQMRQYFIAVEEQWNSPDAIMARALQLSNAKLKEMQITVSTLTVENQIMKPKAEYFDELVDRNLLTGIRETAGELGVKQNQFVTFLLEKKYMYRDKKGKLTAYAKPLADGLFERKECMNEKTQWKGTQDLVTPKGRETFRLLMVGA